MLRNAVFGAILVVFAFLHLDRRGDLGFTWDEGGDMAIVQCLQNTHDPFACLEDPSQTRLPFYIHALFAHHYWISFGFSLITLLAVYVYARREYGAWTANAFAALYATSPALLASGRMVLTHSSIIFTCFTTLSFLALLEYARTSRRAWFYACAVLTGLAAASHIIAAFNVFFLIAIYLRAKKSWRDLLFIPIAAVTFFATTIVYVSPPILRSLIDACLAGGGKYPFWNYLELGTYRAPWFYAFLLLAIKVGPWLLFAFHRRARWFLIALFVDLLLKGTAFGYETPHHQVQFYPLLYLFIAIGIVHWWRRWLAVIVALLFAVQIYDVARFFPNYLFYGAQYGDRFIGEFYGPAVLHAQGRGHVWEAINAIRARDPEAKILIADNNMFDASGDSFVPFTKRDPKVVYRYALVDRLYAKHFRFPERDAYNAYLAANYRVVYETKFPTGVWVYRVMELR